MAMAAEVLGDRWTLLILREAFYGVVRYDDMREDLNAPRSMLTDRLAKLVENGILSRKSYQEAGDRARQAYVLTAKGLALAPTFMAMTAWGEAHVLGGPAPVMVADKDTGKPLKVALTNDDGEVVDLSKATLTKST